MSRSSFVLRVISAAVLAWLSALFGVSAILLWPTVLTNLGDATAFATCVTVFAWLSWLLGRLVLNRPNRYGGLLHPAVLIAGGGVFLLAPIGAVVTGAFTGPSAFLAVLQSAGNVTIGVGAIAAAIYMRRQASGRPSASP